MQSDQENLDTLFAELRHEEASPPEALFSRVLADASALQPTPVIAPVQHQNVLQKIADAIGGWPAISGVAAAGVAGLWVGLAPPASIDAWAADMLGTTTSVSLIGEFTAFEDGTLDG